MVTCEENPCGNNQEFLAHPKSWDPTNISNPICHKVKDGITGCEVKIGEDDSLECCVPTNRTICNLQDVIEVFSVIKQGVRTCRRGFIYSKYRNRCVRLFRRSG